MASVFKRDDGTVVIKWKDAAGKWRQKRWDGKQSEGLRLAQDLERQAERQRLGLEPLPGEQSTWTFAELMDWWWNDYGRRLRSETTRAFLDKHCRRGTVREGSREITLAELPLGEVTAARVESLIVSRDELGPASRNRLRGIIHRLFALAIRFRRWQGENPAKLTTKHSVPKRLPSFLREDEVEPVLLALPLFYRPLFATAISTGLRRGELLALRKSSVDLVAGVIRVERSGDSDTTKGEHADVVPIIPQLRPYLEAAMKASPSELVFAQPDGSPLPSVRRLERTLRRALVKAGLVTTWLHACRRPGCPTILSAQDKELRRCPDHGAPLWPRPQPRPLRFHDLRHTTATLLLKAGVKLAVVQRLMRHTDPKITAEVYGHLDIDDMRAGAEQLVLPTVPLADDFRGAPVVRPAKQVHAARRRPRRKPLDSGTLPLT